MRRRDPRVPMPVLKTERFILVQIAPDRQALWKITGQGVCRSCQAPILWCLTQHGKPIPVNPLSPGQGVSVSHFATCPQAKGWRKS